MMRRHSATTACRIGARWWRVWRCIAETCETSVKVRLVEVGCDVSKGVARVFTFMLGGGGANAKPV